MQHAVLHLPKLILKLRESILQECEISEDELLIGRKRDNDLAIDDPAVSGHHARIVRIQSVYFVEDIGSTNGTFVNDMRIDRKQLRDADVIRVGKHRLIFQEDAKNAALTASAPCSGSDQTMVVSTEKRAGGSGKGRASGMLQIIAGRTAFSAYHLTKPLTIIGSRKDAGIRLTGYFAPKIGAMLARRGESYSISVPEGGKPIRVNDTVIKGQTILADGDLIDVSGVKMYFSLQTPSKG